jgi:hypothetical protein
MYPAETEIAERLHAAGWRFVDRDLPYTPPASRPANKIDSDTAFAKVSGQICMS